MHTFWYGLCGNCLICRFSHHFRSVFQEIYKFVNTCGCFCVQSPRLSVIIRFNSVVSFDHLCIKEKWINSLFVNILWVIIVLFCTYTLVKLHLSWSMSLTNGYGQSLSKPGDNITSIWKCSKAVRNFWKHLWMWIELFLAPRGTNSQTIDIDDLWMSSSLTSCSLIFLLV